MKIRSKSHREFVASEPCIITGYQGERGVPHHLLRITKEDDGNEAKGTASKSCDRWCVPLEFTMREVLHKYGNEKVFFANHGLDYEAVKQIARDLSNRSPDVRIRKITKEQ